MGLELKMAKMELTDLMIRTQKIKKEQTKLNHDCYLQ